MAIFRCEMKTRKSLLTSKKHRWTQVRNSRCSTWFIIFPSEKKTPFLDHCAYPRLKTCILFSCVHIVQNIVGVGDRLTTFGIESTNKSELFPYLKKKINKKTYFEFSHQNETNLILQSSLIRFQCVRINEAQSYKTKTYRKWKWFI